MDEATGINVEYSTRLGIKRSLKIVGPDGEEASFEEILNGVKAAVNKTLVDIDLTVLPDEFIFAMLATKQLTGGDSSLDLAACTFAGMLLASLIDGMKMNISVLPPEPLTKEDLPAVYDRINQQAYRKLVSLQTDMLRYVDLHRDILLNSLDDLGLHPNEDSSLREGSLPANTAGDDSDSVTEDTSKV